MRKLMAFAAMLLLPTGAYAHCDEEKHAGNHPHCANGDDDGGNGSTKVIGVHDDTSHAAMVAPLWAPSDPPSDPPSGCLMLKGTGKNLSGAFPRHDLCATLYTKISNVTVATLGDDITVVVSTNRQGAVQAVQVRGQDFIGSIGVVHVSDVMVPDSVTHDPDGSMVIHVHSDDVQMLKCDTHVLKKKSKCTIDAGKFAIDDLVYSTAP